MNSVENKPLLKAEGGAPVSPEAGAAHSERHALAGAMMLLILALVSAYAFLYILIVEHSFLGLFKVSIFANEFFVYSLVLLLTFVLSRHVIQIKLVLYRIFLQTFLDTESSIYKFFANGFMVRLIAVIFAFALSINILIFLTMLNVHKPQYIFLCAALTAYMVYNRYHKPSTGYSFIRKDVNTILKSYLVPFIIASTAAIGVSCYDMLTIDTAENISSLSQALEKSIQAINRDEVSWPLRVIVRHIYAYELIIQQVMNIPVFGGAIYFIYTFLSEGAMTFFSVLLIFMPYRKEGK